MPIVNYANKAVQFKIVYYGPALSGKTSNLSYIHSRIGPDHRGDLITLSTAADRTLFFDYLPLSASILSGYRTTFQLYAVPGRVMYDSTRQLVLRGVDGIVFVADSQWEKASETVKSFQNLQENLARQSRDVTEIQYVLAYNKRDLADIAPVSYLEYLLNNQKHRVRSFETIASTGFNVFAALDAVTQGLLHQFTAENPRGPFGAKPDRQPGSD